MFDLAKAISSNASRDPEQRGPAGFSLFFQTAQCHELVEEVCRFEGWPTPVCEKDTHDINPEKLQDIVILELNNSHNVVADAQQFASQMPNKKGIIIIGKEDAITTMRSLKEMGFYYLFWPMGKQELTDFFRHVHANQQKFAGVSKNRKAKQISIVGTRGGCGTTLIAVEVAAALADSGAETVLVDHKYHFSNIDIMLGQKNLAKQDVKNISLQLHELDEDAAFSYLSKIQRRLNLMGLTGSAPQRELTEYTYSLCDLLLRQANFMVEDYSASIDFPVDIDALFKRSDIIVLVLEPSVTSLRNCQSLLDQITKFNLDGNDDTRVLLVANFHRPESAFSLSLQEMQQYLESELDVVIPYNKQSAHHVLEGRRLYKQESGKHQPLTSLHRLINGQITPVKSSPISLFKEVFKR